MITKEIIVECDYKIGMRNNVDAKFDIEAEENYFKRDLNDFTDFLSHAIKGQRNFDLCVTVTKCIGGISNLEDSKRFLVRSMENGFEYRSFNSNSNGYSDVELKTFGSEGNCKLEMKKSIIKLIKQFNKELNETI